MDRVSEAKGGNGLLSCLDYGYTAHDYRSVEAIVQLKKA